MPSFQHEKVMILSYIYISKGAPACKAIPEVEGGGSGQAAEKNIWGGTDFVCILTYFSIIYLKPARLRLFGTYLARIFYSINFLCPD
jgi:hypothetical protein